MAGPIELLIVLFLVFLVMGPRRITRLFRSLGRGARDFKDELERKIDGELPGKKPDDEEREK